MMSRLISSATGSVALITLLVLAVRLPFFRFAAHQYDSFAMAEWTWALVTHGPGAFYATQLEVAPDHLPGDLWILYLLGLPTHAIANSYNFYDHSFSIVLKLFAVAGDLAIALGILQIGTTLTSRPRAMAVATGFAISPAAVAISGVWGQWDSLSMACVVIALLLVLRQRFPLAAVLFVLACLIKPQLGILLPGVAIYFWRTTASGPSLWSQVKGLPWLQMVWSFVAAGVTFTVVCLPFGVSLTGSLTKWSIGDRLSFAMDRYQSTTMGALNIWMIPIGREVAPLDSQVLTAGLTYREAGIALMAVSFVFAWIGAGRIADPAFGLIWSSVVCTFGFFLFTTRAHERYLFPALVLSFLLVLFEIRVWWIPAMLSLTLVVSIGSSLAWGWMPGGTTLGIPRDQIVRALSVANLAVFVAVIRIGVQALLAPDWRFGQTRQTLSRSNARMVSQEAGSR